MAFLLHELQLWTWAHKSISLSAAIALYAILHITALVAYRLVFSSLSSFPGPKIAAATYWYEFYYDWLHRGKYIFVIEKMHEKYGPIVRINPDELSISDPDFYSDIYVAESRRRTDNYHSFIKGIDFDGSHLLTTEHDLHRRRRKPLEPFFSRLGVSRLWPVLAELVEKFAGRLEALKGTGSVIRLDHACSAFSGDIIGQICWNNEEKFLDDPNFAPEWYNLIQTIILSIPLFTAFPLLVQIMALIPESIILWAYPSGQIFNKFKDVALQHIAKAKKQTANSKGAKHDNLEGHGSLFHHILNSDMPESELSDERLAKEAQVLLGGGTASTARTIGYISYYILARPTIRSKLQEELKDVMAAWPQHVPSLTELERLPYLQGLIKEGLRHSYGVMHRLPRCSPDVPIQYKQWSIPVGVPVGMSSYLMHTDPTVYERPFEFIPERWLGAVHPNMNRNFVPFSRGSRNCLGQNLAHAEINLALAVLHRPGGPQLELFETDESDIIHVHDYMIPLPKLSTKGVRVLVR